MQTQSAIAEFKERFDKKAAAGVSDIKFYTSAGIGECTLEEFCAEANEIDRAIEREEYSDFKFGDSPIDLKELDRFF